MDSCLFQGFYVKFLYLFKFLFSLGNLNIEMLKVYNCFE